MKCQRPLVTSLLIVCWVAVIIGTLITHASLGTLVPAVEDLPANLAKGFDEVFKFAQLEIDAAAVKEAARGAVAACGQDAASLCPSEPKADCIKPGTSQPCYPAESDSSRYKNKIQASFTNSLSIIQKVANDKYLGSGDLKDTAHQLNNITAEMNRINSSKQPCNANIEVYCSIYNVAVPMHESVTDVNAEIDKMKEGKAIKDFEDRASSLNALHVLPWLFILALSFYCCFWFCGYGTCCCCSESGGKCLTTLLLIPHILLCLVFFVFVCMFIGIWFIWDQFILQLELEELNGNPTVENVLTHIQETYPDFWDTVFAEIERGLKSFLGGLWILLFATIITVVYEFLVCICRPYKPEAKTES